MKNWQLAGKIFEKILLTRDPRDEDVSNINIYVLFRAAINLPLSRHINLYPFRVNFGEKKCV